jgi:hypothetical protein
MEHERLLIRTLFGRIVERSEDVTHHTSTKTAKHISKEILTGIAVTSIQWQALNKHGFDRRSRWS